MGQLVPEETFTHSWSSIPYLLHPSTTIHGILPVQSTPDSLFPQSLSKFSNRKSLAICQMFVFPMTLTDPELPQTTPFLNLVSHFLSLERVKLDFKYGICLINDHSKSQPTNNNHSIKGSQSQQIEPKIANMSNYHGRS